MDGFDRNNINSTDVFSYISEKGDHIIQVRSAHKTKQRENKVNAKNRQSSTYLTSLFDISRDRFWLEDKAK